MDNLEIDNKKYSRIPSEFRRQMTEQGYQIEYSGTKYGFMTSFLAQFVTNNFDQIDPEEITAKSSTSWGLAKAYLMYLNYVDVQNRRTIPDTFIQTDVLTHDDIRYLSGRGGVLFYDEFSETSYSVRDLIRLIGHEEYLDFLRWMELFY